MHDTVAKDHEIAMLQFNKSTLESEKERLLKEQHEQGIIYKKDKKSFEEKLSQLRVQYDNVSEKLATVTSDYKRENSLAMQ